MINQPFMWLLIIPMISSLGIYIFGRLAVSRIKRDAVNPASYLSLFVLLLTMAFYGLTARNYISNGSVSIDIASVKLTFDGISLLMIGVLLLLSFAVILFSMRYLHFESHQTKYYAQLMILISSIIGLTCATDIFNLYVWFELMAISTYTLVSYYRERTEPLEAGIKYLLQSASGSALVILGIAIIFGATGSLEIQAIQQSLHTASPYFLVAAAACFLAGYGIKCAFVPMHFWLPDAHSQAPAGISAMLSGIVIETGLIVLLKSLSTLKYANLPLGSLFLVFGALNMLVGNFSALRQTEIKRLLAFSSISHMGYIAVGVGFALSYPISAENSQGIFAHIFNHAMMKGLAFLSAGALVYYLKITRGSHQPLYKEDLNGISRTYPFLALAFSISVLALGGLPFFSGFISKWQILASGAQANTRPAFFMIVLMGLNSVLSLAYYAPLVNRMYQRKPVQPAVVEKTSRSMTAALLLLTIIVILLGFVPDLIDGYAKFASDALLQMFY